MDPLSVPLAIVALATAVKDLIELGQKIHESFVKVSNNHRNAQRVSEDIKEMVEEIQIFCEDHKNVLVNMKDFRMALQALVGKFRYFETSILPLLPQTGGSRQDRLVQGWDAWRHNNKIEEAILDLQSHIVRMMRRYMMTSAMRTEVKLESIHQETSRSLTNISRSLEGVQRDVSALRMTTAATAIGGSYQSTRTTSDDFNRNIIMFAGSTPSTSAPMLRTPDAITEELLTAAYIKLQINNIAIRVDTISSLPASAPESVKIFQLSPMIEQRSMDITYLRHHLVRQVTFIRDCLDAEHIQTLSIYDSAHTLVELSIGLETVGMRDESILVGGWAVTLGRKLVDASTCRQPDLDAALARYLHNHAVLHDINGDKVRSLQIIEEAYPITKNLRNQYSGEARFLMLHSRILLQYAHLVDNQRAIGMFIEGIQILEGLLDVQAFTQGESHGNVEQVVRPNLSFFNRLFPSQQPIATITSYAYALQYLGTYLFVDGHLENALNLALLAVAVHRKIVSIYGQKYEVDLAMALSSLVQDESARHIPADELINMTDEGARLLRELADKNPLFYTRELVSVLWSKARTLERLNRNTEAISTWEEIASLAGQIMQDSELCASALGHLSRQFRRLKRHDDAVRTGTLAITTYKAEVSTRASRYFNLSKDLQHLRRYKESAEAAWASVELCRQLAMKQPEKWTISLMKGLSNLAHCLVASDDSPGALVTWKESISMFDNLLRPDADASMAIIQKYLLVLGRLILTSYILEDKEECLEVGSIIVQYLRKLLKLHPQNADVIVNLWWTESCYVYNMLQIGRLQKAQQFVDHWLDVWSNKPEATSEGKHAGWRATMITLKADILDAQGYTEQALLATKKIHGIVKLSVNTYRHCLREVVSSIAQEARLRVDLGDSEEALQVAEEALRLSQENKPEPFAGVLVQSLYAVASTALACHLYERAFEAAHEGCDIYTSPEDLKNWQTHERKIFIRPKLLACLSSAEANLGRYGAALASANRALDASLEISDMKLYISATAAERVYMEMRGNLADILLANGDVFQARQICEERSAYFSKRVEGRMGEYRGWAPTLRMLGILCCSEGDHEEGIAAAQELARIVKMLGSAFPSLQKQIKTRLRNQGKVPILKVLSDMAQRLDCEHQVHLLSLFET